MKFCPRCKSIMNHVEKDIWKCDDCGIVEIGDLVSKEKQLKKEEIGEGVVKDENIFADYEHVCKKCGHNKAQVIERQPYISDEDSLTFLKCGKCGYTVQLSRKIG